MPQPHSLIEQIVSTLRFRFGLLQIHYEAGWTDSWSHRRCLHKHETLLDAAECAMPTGAGWYVFAVENGSPRELNENEDLIVNKFRFGPHWNEPNKAVR